jgi:thioredoxin reductase
MNDREVIIIGAGPSGIGAAIQLRRYGIRPMIFEKDRVGGLLKNADLVGNYPGFPDGVTGTELISLMKKQVEHAADIIYERVVKADYRDGFFEISCAREVFRSQFLVIATGTSPIEYTDIDMPTDTVSAVFYEIYPIIHSESKKIAIVGAGDAAFDYALNLGRKNDVVILNRGTGTRCLPLLRDRVEKSNKIVCKDQTRLLSVNRSRDERLTVACRCPDGDFELEVDYLVFAIGRKPALEFLSDNIKNNLDKLTGDGSLHLIGDVKNDIYRQTAIAVGDGVLAAMKIYRKMKGIA